VNERFTTTTIIITITSTSTITGTTATAIDASTATAAAPLLSLLSSCGCFGAVPRQPFFCFLSFSRWRAHSSFPYTAPQKAPISKEQTVHTAHMMEREERKVRRAKVKRKREPGDSLSGSEKKRKKATKRHP